MSAHTLCFRQLRPKVDHYLLTVEKGDGYDLNRSLFERLILKGFPHTSLGTQHRMRPEISSYVNALTYPELKDAPDTSSRPNVRGLQNNVIFLNHDHPEDDLHEVPERRDSSISSSKENKYCLSSHKSFLLLTLIFPRHEVEMVLKTLRYLGQQGYGTDKIVILTPYLGQLRQLQEALRKTNDPILNDLDSADLVRAGLVSTSAAKLTKKPIRLATIGKDFRLPRFYARCR